MQKVNNAQNIIDQKSPANENELLKRDSSSTLTECLALSSPTGHFTVASATDDTDVIRAIECDMRFLECGRCNLIENRGGVALAVSADEDTAICLKTQLRQHYADTIIITEPTGYQKYRFKIIGCRFAYKKDPTEDDLTQAEEDFRISNRIEPGTLFKLEQMYDTHPRPTSIHQLRGRSGRDSIKKIPIDRENIRSTLSTSI